jgi:hypothetical protein
VERGLAADRRPRQRVDIVVRNAVAEFQLSHRQSLHGRERHAR